MNPLDQLEEIKNATKSISLENASARGTKVLRIEIAKENAKELLKAKLVKEMDEVRNRLQQQVSQLKPSLRQKADKNAERQWSAGKQQLIHMLDQAEAKVTYHLTINKKNGLPIRLTSETKLNYRNLRGIQEHEVLLSDNRFSNYQ
ncbi:hypothetical protein D3C73_731960 [compost metagenome]